jgi:hypothetical protein
LVAGPARADDDLPGRVGRIAEQAGELFLAPQDAPDQWVAIGLNYPVTTGDNLWVGKDGRAEIDFGAGQARLAGDTSLHVSRLDDRIFALFVAQGRVIVRVRVLDPGDAARIDTPNAQVLLTRAGLYRIEVSEDRQHTQVAVREGEADIDTGVAVQQVLPGQSATLDGTSPQVAQMRNGLSTDGFDTWSANRDRYYERGRANSPASREMVGYADLDQYGAWDTAPEYGAVWYPANVGGDWAPYRNGYWTEVGAWGPTWVDYAPWGYAPFHYGRWAYIGGRWGWCPGRHVGRPVWAPALVVWVGGPGWRFAPGAPVYGWVPLGWGEAYHPHWRGCGDRCWANYNKPYAVNVSARTSTPSIRYANMNAPGAVTAVTGAVLTGRRSVQANRVAIPSSAVASAPVLSAPLVRPEIRQAAGIKPGDGIPPPASTFSAAMARPSMNRTPVAIPSQVVTVPPATPVPASSPPLRVAPPVAKSVPGAPSPANANNPPVWRTTNPAAGATPVYTPPPRIDAKPAMQTPPAPVAVMPNVPAGQGRGPPTLPNTARERGPVVVPTLTPAPSLAPQVHQAPPAPALHAVPGAPTPVAPAGHSGDRPKVEKPTAPAAHVPGEGPAK